MPVKKEELKKYIETRNNKKYVYESTSKMENGKKTTKTRYIGRQDPNTGQTIEKKPRKTKAQRQTETTNKLIHPQEGLTSKEHGSIYFLDKIQNKIGLETDLTTAFGDYGKTILGLAFTQTIDPSAFADIEYTLEKTTIPQRFNIKGDMSSPRISDITRIIGESADCINLYFDQRIKRSKDIISWDTTTDGTYSKKTGLAEWAPSKDNDGLKQVKIGLATDLRGVPILFDLYPGSLSDVVLLKRFVNSVRVHGKDCLFVMDNGFESAGNVSSLLEDGVRFVMPADRASKAVKRLLSEFLVRTDDVVDRVHDGHAYRVWETELAVVSDSSRRTVDGGPAFTYLSVFDEGFFECKVRVAAFVCFDSKKCSDEEQALMVWLDLVEREVLGRVFKDPEQRFFEIAGGAAKYFDVVYDGGRVLLSRKRDVLSFVHERAGLFVMLVSQGVCWDVMMDAYDARCLTEQVFDCCKNVLGGRRFRSGNLCSVRGRFFVKLVALVLRCEVVALLRELGLRGVTVDGVLRSMGNIRLISYGGVRVVTEVTKKNRELYKVFDIDVPTAENYTHI